MHYLVLARRYRPQRFSEVVGQQAILTTLQNALRFHRVAHAYLFCGARGVGKTTLARLFAKALNCHAPQECEPCNQCPSCLEILSGQSLDVIEIDGASNRGIDDIRQLNETVGYAPSHGKYKIIIIDEVHMLTKEAFNALLKTLEEPPPQAKFFFATTEPHKVLPTIVSRCQRFDLLRLTETQIKEKLSAITCDLKREVTEEALKIIASFAEGSLRDAESLFDQLLCFTEGPISKEQVESVLGLVPDEFFFSLDIAFSEGRLSFAFELVEQLFSLGRDLLHFTEQLIGHYRKLLLIKMGELPETPSSRLYHQAQLLFILDLLLSSLAPLQKSPMPRVNLEALLLQILRSKQRIPLEVLIRRLHDLEQKLEQKTPQSSSEDFLCKPGEQNEPARKNPTQSKIDSSSYCALKDKELSLQPVPFQPTPSISIMDQPKIDQEDPQNVCSERGSIAERQAASENKHSEANPTQQKTDSCFGVTDQESSSDFLIRISGIAQEQNLSESQKEKKEPKQDGTDSSIPPGMGQAKQNIEPVLILPGRTETLLRFAAVELEGTLRMEK